MAGMQRKQTSGHAPFISARPRVADFRAEQLRTQRHGQCRSLQGPHTLRSRPSLTQLDSCQFLHRPQATGGWVPRLNDLGAYLISGDGSKP